MDFKPFIYAGGAPTVRLTAKTEDIDVKDAVTHNDIGLVFGGGFAGRWQQCVITLEGRYTPGLVKIVKYEKLNQIFQDVPDYQPYTEKPEIKNSNISILLGFGFW